VPSYGSEGMLRSRSQRRLLGRAWFGVRALRVHQDGGLCASAILQDGPWIVTDAIDARTLTNPLVAGSFTGR
jgi:eukaryotic-like serine/threonine-protein kinase